MKKLLCVVVILSLLLCGCGVLQDSPGTTTTGVANGDGGMIQGAPSIEVDFAKTDEDMFTKRDADDAYSADKATVILLNGDSVTCNSASVKVDGTALTIAGEGTYLLRGTLTNGAITVNAGASDKIQLVLDGVDIASADGPALWIQEADKVFVTLAKGSENRLSNGGSLSEDLDGAVFSKQDLTFNGTGSLTVESPVAHGIVCKDDLVFTGGSYIVNAAYHGLDANDSLRFKGASLKLDTGKDGIHVEDNDKNGTGFVYISGGTMEIEAEGDGISAALWMQIAGGTVDILSGGGHENGESHSSSGYGDFMGGMPGGPGRPGGRAVSTATTTEDSGTSMKGLKTAGGLLIAGGNITIDSADDGIHSNAAAVIHAGTIEIAAGDDGIHADTDLKIAAGTVNISTCYEGLEAQNVHVAGGKISMVTTDDGINAAGGNDSSGTGGRDQMHGPREMHAGNGSIVVDGGDLHIQSSGDGMDANGYIEINGGKTVVCGPNRGDTATLDYDTSGTINGGIFIGTGSSMMAQSFSANAQGVLALQVNSQSAGATITVTDKDGKVLLNHQPVLDFSVFIFSAPELVSGQTYHITIGDVEGDMQAS